MATQDIYEIWNKDGSGVLSEEPLILTACKEGKLGTVLSYPGGAIYKTIFTYLSGKPDEAFLAENPDVIYNTRLVCMSSEWEENIRKLPIKFILRRELMAPLCAESKKEMRALPEGYSISSFTEEIFEAHPFDHGRGYADYQDFSEKATGAVVLFDGKVVSASSSFLTFEDHVELDVFTDEEHRGKGLADHCVYEMIRQSHSKGLTVHWDAQNPMSAKMAISHGFVPQAEYAVYWLEK
ncbi:MAG: GNAT family N-acetyltransferase [Clostridiales bacterium]|jgi:GNAT superfamily N-acetyltransferase|nr:GNAT family N-acetyltransferase [Clostridiales bacterium]